MSFEKGDKVKFASEGEVDFCSAYYFGVRFPNGEWVSARPSQLEKIAPPVTTFVWGQTVRSKTSGLVYSIGRDGYFDHTRGKWNALPALFTSKDYELVELPTKATAECSEPTPPPVTGFKSGQSVRFKKTGSIRHLGDLGYLLDGAYFKYGVGPGFDLAEFTSKNYELV